MTGNRYLYAGANPANYIGDGHAPCRKVKELVDPRRLSKTYKVADSSRAGYRWQTDFYYRGVYRTRKVCDRAGLVDGLKHAAINLAAGAATVTVITSNLCLLYAGLQQVRRASRRRDRRGSNTCCGGIAAGAT